MLALVYSRGGWRVGLGSGDGFTFDTWCGVGGRWSTLLVVLLAFSCAFRASSLASGALSVWLMVLVVVLRPPVVAEDLLVCIGGGGGG